VARRHRERAKQARWQLICDLGGKCVSCGSVEDLEIDHKDPRLKMYVTNQLDPSWRVSMYRREAKYGMLQVLCADCNSRKGNREGPLRRRG
jgi:5-methylcytosine-specific restriction endonuclease McrA